MKFVEKDGREWPSKKAYNQYEKNVRKNLWGSLALECYADGTGDTSVYEDEGFKSLCYVRTHRNEMSSKELLETTNFIDERFEAIYDRVGRELFDFCEGKVYYNGEYKMPNKKS